ncbi:MAG: hypothetical protein ACD_76C00068G0003 [uncultured bacterium]|nr:MAG: hypothetical protein ACD_76C00068G0003 [uncultured bacterium]HBD05098.1 hypothetical protein [Candidatus Uhrbacteria bacterium]
MAWFISAILFPIPLINLWLHAFLPFWRRHKRSFPFVALIFWVASFFWFKKLSVFSPDAFAPTETMVLVGYALMIIGFLFVILSVLTLGIKRFFLVAVLDPKGVEQVRIKIGVFRHFPHPAYVGYLIVAAGNFLSSGAIYLGGVLIFLLFLMPIIILLEEHELEKRLNI